jgi:outer membrane protein TolC
LLAANFFFNRGLQKVCSTSRPLLPSRRRAPKAAGGATWSWRARCWRRPTSVWLVGLATKPEMLLARQLEAQARYDLENAVVAVKNGEADLAVTLGVRADRPLHIEPLAEQTPSQLDGAVETVIADALRDRPDLAAKAAELRAAEAQVAKARADFLPTVGFRGAYGQQIWNYDAGDQSTLRQ